MDIQTKIEKFFSTYPTGGFNKGDVIIQAGYEPPVYFIATGLVIQYDITKNGDMLILNTYKPGAFLPLVSVLNSGPSEFYFEAVEETNVLVAPVEDVADFLKSNPDVIFEMLARITKGTNGILHRLARNMEGSAEGRIMQELAIMNARFAGGSGAISVTETQLASQTGLARETVSRTLRRMNEKGLVRSSRGLIRLL